MAHPIHIHVRPLELSDFGFVQRLASKQTNFTVPPKYVLWLMLRIKGAISLVAEHSHGKPLAYILSVPVENHEESVFVWQLAATRSKYSRSATVALMVKFREILLARHVRTIGFSSVPGSSNYRAVRLHSSKVFESVPVAITSIPLAICPSEMEFVLALNH